MFLERHIEIFDKHYRYANLKSMFEDGPGWHSVSDWKICDETKQLRCRVGWNSIYDQYYFALLGSCDECCNFYYRNIGLHYENGEYVADVLKKIEKSKAPPPRLNPFITCVIS